MGVSCSTPRRMRNIYKILWGNMKGRYYSEDLVVDGRIILEWILEK
jgi:hypothetical protein